MNQFTLWDRLRYRFDSIMARGTIALLGLLFLASALFILLLAFLVWVTGVDVQPDGSHFGFPGLVWMMLLRTLDSGTMGGDIGTDEYLGAMLAVTFGGIFVVSILIGIINNGIQARVEDLRRGRSVVVERAHTVILGWSPNIFTVLSELVTANANHPDQCIAILADRDKVIMEEEVRAHIPDTKTTRIVCRTGSPIEPTDLNIVNPGNARAILVLSPESPNPDSQVIKTLLALLHSPTRRADPYHIVAEIHDSKTMALAEIVGGGEAQFVPADELVNHILVQTCRQTGLSAVCNELLGFEGDEIYFFRVPELVGKTFRDAVLELNNGTVMGIWTGDGRALLNPPYDTVLTADDQLIVIAADDDAPRLAPFDASRIDESAILTKPPAPKPPDRMLMLNWNAHAFNVILELDQYVLPDSTMTLVTTHPDIESELAEQRANLKNISVRAQLGDPTDRHVLDALALDAYDHVIVLGAGSHEDLHQADANTLITLLHLRDLRERHNYKFSIVSEMLDTRNRGLAQVTRADDFVVSDQLASAMLAQVAENKHLIRVFNELFSAEGSELYLKPVSDYVTLDRPINFYTLLEAARRRNQIAVGYLIYANRDDPASGNGVTLNPPKERALAFTPQDRLVVLAQD